MAKKNFKFNLNLDNLKDTLTDTISTVADKVLDLADAAADTAKSGQQIAKLYVEKKKEEAALEEAYQELGKLYYEMHKAEAEGVLADLCAEIENTLINIEDISSEIEALKEAADGDFEEFEDDDFDDDEGESYLEQVAETVEDALDGLDDAIEAVLERMEATAEQPDTDLIDDEVEVSIEEYLNDDDFAAPAEDPEIDIEVIELPGNVAEEEIKEDVRVIE